MLRSVSAVRYVTPLREGGSLPALVEADDDGLYVVKLRGAGQGPKALVAELVAGELAREPSLPHRFRLVAGGLRRPGPERVRVVWERGVETSRPSHSLANSGCFGR